jgi:hypothetical protein
MLKSAFQKFATGLLTTASAVVMMSPASFGNTTPIVDGDISEWTSADFFAPMHRAGNPAKVVESNLHLRYDCTTSTLYAMVLVTDGVYALQQPSDAYLKWKPNQSDTRSFKGIGVEGSEGQSAWVFNTEGTLIGWEGAFEIPTGTYWINAHVQVFDSGSSQTSATTNGSSSDRFIAVTINECSEPPSPPASTYSLSGVVNLDPATCETPNNTFAFGGIQVQLTNALTGEDLGIFATDDTGAFLATGLAPGQYSISFINPDPATFYLAPGSVDTQTVTIDSSDATANTVLFNEFVDIAGQVQIDVGGSASIAFPGVSIDLLGVDDSGSEVAQSTTTSNAGTFVFENLRLAGAAGYTLVYSYQGDVLQIETLPATCSFTEATGQARLITYAMDPGSVLAQITNGTLGGVGRTIGFWKAQLSGRKGNGNNLWEAMPSLLGAVETLAFDQPFVLSPAAEGVVDLTGVAQALQIIDDKNNRDPYVKLLKQMLASELNSVTPGIGGLTNNLLEGALFAWGEAIYSQGAPESQVLLAKDIFDTMNNMGH